MKTSMSDPRAELPVPRDDGAADHLTGSRLPSLSLPSTSGTEIMVSSLGPLTILYVYPMTGKPGIPLPEGWDLIPGARGCTAEACAFRDHDADLKVAGATVYGLSSQSTEDQREARSRLHLPFHLLSDERLAMADALGLPTFDVHGQRLFKRLTLVVVAGLVEHVFYPVFPPEEHAEQVLAWLRERSIQAP
jgi:peroxiredoxin